MDRYDLSSSNVFGQLPVGAYKASGISLAIGFFDGIHQGHLAVITRAIEIAKDKGLIPAVMTFDPHPRVALGQGSQYHTVLTPLEDKLNYLAEAGIETAYVIHFDREFSQVSPEQFIQSLIMPLGVKATIVGFDFSFGHRGSGNAETLRQNSQGQYEVEVISPIYRDGEKVSSTRIREQLAQGECSVASKLLGKPYVIKGTVIHGQARGRQLGFPTANVSLEESYVIPKSGVYAVQVEVLDSSGNREARYNGVINVGYNPTFDESGKVIKLEVHLLDYSGDLYGRRLALIFHTFLRPERRFESVDQLIKQITLDAADARKQLSNL